MEITNNKFYMKCSNCGYNKFDLIDWFNNNQCCPFCSSKHAEIEYNNLASMIIKSLNNKIYRGMWTFYDVLPLLSKDNIITSGEGNVGIERWKFLEDFAWRYYSIDCKVYAHRQDNNSATGSFKDLAGSLVASVLKENNIYNYVVASTGNIGVAYSKYISDYGGASYVFIPKDITESKEKEILMLGQKVFRVDGDYTKAKQYANDFANKHSLLNAVGTLDPLRIESKKTMVYDWFYNLKKLPTVYIQALSGGTGVLGVEKGCRELIDSNIVSNMPRFILVQSDKCNPMAKAWKDAKYNNFRDNWNIEYPIYNNPITKILTLATGDPSAYPIISKYIKKSNGGIISFSEECVIDIAKFVAFESSARIGPAAAIAIGGFLKSLKESLIRNGDDVLINIGEGIRREIEFLNSTSTNNNIVNNIEQCNTFDREKYRKQLWCNIRGIV